jgi:hypothetical protein
MRAETSSTFKIGKLESFLRECGRLRGAEVLKGLQAMGKPLPAAPDSKEMQFWWECWEKAALRIFWERPSGPALTVSHETWFKAFQLEFQDWTREQETLLSQEA